MYLCEVAIVSQLCISFPYVLHGLCEDYLTCDIAFNAVMPLSRASTRGGYSRVMGITVLNCCNQESALKGAHCILLLAGDCDAAAASWHLEDVVAMVCGHHELA